MIHLLSAGTPIAREEPLPTTTPELLAELAKRAQSVTMLLDEGNLGGLWYPAIGAKDVALALEENHMNDLPEAQRPKMASAVKRLTLAAWQIDAAGDLGNKELLLPLYQGLLCGGRGHPVGLWNSVDNSAARPDRTSSSRLRVLSFLWSRRAHRCAQAGDVEVRLQQGYFPAAAGSLRPLPRRGRTGADVAHDVQRRGAVG